MKKVVLITGCRSGFGKLTAMRLGENGHLVYAGLRDLKTAEELMADCEQLPVTPLQLDVTNSQQRKKAVDTIIKEQGRIDVLVNNAGIALGGFLEQIADDELRKVIEVNLFGSWGMTCDVLPVMRNQKSGLVVMMSSMSGRMALPGLGAYTISKFAMEGMGETWRHELALFGIQVVLLEPGAYRTEIFGRNRAVSRNAYQKDSPYAVFMKGVDETFEKSVDRIARDPVEVANCIVKLLERKRTPLRIPIGPGAKERSTLLKLLPFQLTEKVLSYLLKRAEKRHRASG